MVELCCFCPMKHVNWMQAGTLAAGNLPCDPIAYDGLEKWHYDPWRGFQAIIIPSEAQIWPGWFLWCPLTWPMFPCMGVCLHITVFSIEESQDGLSLFLVERSKGFWDDRVPMSKGVVSGSTLLHTKSQSFFSSDSHQVNITISGSHGLLSVPLQKVVSSSVATQHSLEALVTAINTKVGAVWNRRAAQTFAQAPSAPPFMPPQQPYCTAPPEGYPVPGWAPGLPIPPMQPQIQYPYVASPIQTPIAGEPSDVEGYYRHPSFSGTLVYAQPVLTQSIYEDPIPPKHF